MRFALRKGPLFERDVVDQFTWYWDEAGEDVAWQFKAAVDATLLKLAGQPRSGHERNFRNPLLRGLRSIRVVRPFERISIFYRIGDGVLDAWRLMRGARDLPHRLFE